METSHIKEMFLDHNLVGMIIFTDYHLAILL